MSTTTPVPSAGEWLREQEAADPHSYAARIRTDQFTNIAHRLQQLPREAWPGELEFIDQREPWRLRPVVFPARGDIRVMTPAQKLDFIHSGKWTPPSRRGARK